MRKPAMRILGLLIERYGIYLQIRNIGRPAIADALDDRRKDTEMNIMVGFKNWYKYRETYNELARMTQRELADIGISRADIDKVARKAVAGY